LSSLYHKHQMYIFNSIYLMYMYHNQIYIYLIFNSIYLMYMYHNQIYIFNI